MLSFEIWNDDRPSVGLKCIVAALTELGGAAHLSAIYQRVKWSTKDNGYDISLDELIATLIAHRSEGVEATDPSEYFYQPFGPDSNRWCLCPNHSGRWLLEPT